MLRFVYILITLNMITDLVIMIVVSESSCPIQMVIQMVSTVLIYPLGKRYLMLLLGNPKQATW